MWVVEGICKQFKQCNQCKLCKQRQQFKAQCDLHPWWCFCWSSSKVNMSTSHHHQVGVNNINWHIFRFLRQFLPKMHFKLRKPTRCKSQAAIYTLARCTRVAWGTYTHGYPWLLAKTSLPPPPSPSCFSYRRCTHTLADYVTSLNHPGFGFCIWCRPRSFPACSSPVYQVVLGWMQTISIKMT